MLIHGRCHCGNLYFELDWKPEPTEIAARACTCGFCTRHGGVWTSNPAGTLKVIVREPSLVSRYSFATRTALFHVCSRCGVVPLVTCEIEGRTYAVVNVNTFEDVAPSLLRRAATNFEGESIESRLSRRKRYWIADVEFVTRGA